MMSFKTALPLAVGSAMLFSFFLPKHAIAWGNTGHEAVAYVAWQQMGSKAREQALALLKLVPLLTSPTKKTAAGFNQWTQDLPPGLSTAEQNQFLFMRAATWADSIKHIGFTDSDNPPKNDPVDPPKGFGDPASHGYWHFVDKDLASDPAKAVPTPTPNAAVQIVELRKDLGTETDAKLRAYELIWLIHLVGDIHQPLHGVRRFVNGKSDLGGNDVDITLPADLTAKFLANRPKGAKGDPPNELHAFWDDLPGVTSDRALALVPAADFAKGLPAASATDVKNTDPAQWADRTFEIAKQDGYVAPIGAGNRDSKGKAFAMTTPYYNTALLDAQMQIALAGARLAKMLNDLWPTPDTPPAKKTPPPSTKKTGGKK